MQFRQESEQGFSLAELTALIELRNRHIRFNAIDEVERSFAERYGVSIENRPVNPAFSSLYWRSHLRRTDGSGEVRELTVAFCTVPEWPSPPTADEIIRWLAAGVAQELLVPDLRGWAARYRINQSGRAAVPCYRGVVRLADSLTVFEAALARERRSLITFLGPSGFIELMESVGVERALLDAIHLEFSR